MGFGNLICKSDIRWKIPDNIRRISPISYLFSYSKKNIRIRKFPDISDRNYPNPKKGPVGRKLSESLSTLAAASLLPPLRPDLGGGAAAATALPSPHSGRILEMDGRGAASVAPCRRRHSGREPPPCRHRRTPITPLPPIGSWRRESLPCTVANSTAATVTASVPLSLLPLLRPDLGAERERGE